MRERKYEDNLYFIEINFTSDFALNIFSEFLSPIRNKKYIHFPGIT